MKNLINLAQRQEFRFAIIGGLNTLLDIAILIILTGWGVDKILANITSTSITFINSFGLNRKFTFKSDAKSKTAIAREMALFTIITLFGLWVIQGFIITAITPAITSLGFSDKLSVIIAKIPATIASLIWNFVMYKKVVFIKK